MTKIDISEWKPFAIGNIFDVIKGTRLTKAHMKSGDIRFIGSSSMNNGCTSLVGNTENMHSENTIKESFVSRPEITSTAAFV